jgi:hypothetical protein
MKAVTVKEIKDELETRSPKELRELCLRLSRFKKENKELITYILFESADEEAYVESVKAELDEQFSQVNRKTYYFIKKGVRKVLKNTKKYIRYSQSKKSEIDLLIWYCHKLRAFKPSIEKNTALKNLYNRQLDEIIVKLKSMHEDLQFDYASEIEALSL